MASKQSTLEKTKKAEKTNLRHPSLYFNRELSWLKFNDRVLEEAEDPNHPLLERLKFVAIFSSNLDEFYMIRVAGVKDQIHAGIYDRAADGLPPAEVDRRISAHVHRAVARQSRVLNDDILPKLSRRGIRIKPIKRIAKDRRPYIERYFQENIFPILTPLAVDPTHPFPQLNGLSINLLVQLRTPYQKDHKIAVVPIPTTLPRFIELPSENDARDFVSVEDIVQQYVGQLFPNMKIQETSLFRITRNADLDLSEAEADDLLKLIERELRKRRVGTVVRLEVEADMSQENRHYLREINGLGEKDVFEMPTYLDLSAFMFFLKLPYPDLKDPPFTPAPEPRLAGTTNIFDEIRKGDILLHHPYDSFNHVVEFIEEAAKDPQVLAIKQTLYRTSGDSPIVKALLEAVNNGKQVTALIELKARFDEQNNIGWAKALDQSGVNVVYGVLGLKTHCKISMVVRKDPERIRRYIHVSTGNYNANTARIYTDLGLMTCDDAMGEDASGLFNLLTGYSLQESWNKFLVAPGTLRRDIAREIKECIEHHGDKHPSRIMIVVNSLVDPSMIRLLYKASTRGVRIDLVVRGICCLRPGVAGISENIKVRSIVGRFLEHPRIFYFKYQGESRIYAGSADLMERNLNRRVELVYPIEDPGIKQKVREILRVLTHDNQRARYLNSDGCYVRAEAEPNAKRLDAQAEFLRRSIERQRDLDTIRY